MEKNPNLWKFRPNTKPTIIATKTTTHRSYAMEINPNLRKFKSCNKIATIIKTVIIKNWIMEKDPNLWKFRPCNKKKKTKTIAIETTRIV